MEQERLKELLAYASVCFKNCTSPFETMHLIKKDVSANECIDLSMEIANIIEENMNEMFWNDEVKDAIKKANKEFLETQE